MGMVYIPDGDIRIMASMLEGTPSRDSFDRAYGEIGNSPFPSDLFYRVSCYARDSLIVNLPIRRGDLIDVANGRLSAGGLIRIREAANKLVAYEEQS